MHPFLNPHIGLMMQNTAVPEIITLAVTWIKSIVAIAMIAKGYNAFDEGQDIGDKAKKALPYGLGLGLVMAPTVITGLMPTGATASSTFMNVLSTWQWMP